MAFLTSIWWYLVLIGVMILVHELGHYWAARSFDVKVETFSFGFGPRLFGFRKGETDFRFSLILFGGYVKMMGEQPGDEASADPRSFMAKPRWQRLIIAFAGPVINVVLAVVLVTGLNMWRFPIIPLPSSPLVGSLDPEGAAAKAGIHEGDRIVQIDDIANPNWEDITLKEIASAKQPIEVWAMRDGQRMHFSITPALDEKNGVGYMGWVQESDLQVYGYVPGLDMAEKAGLIKGDILVSIDGQSIRSITKLHKALADAGGRPVEIVYQRDNQRHSVTITPRKHPSDGEKGPDRWMIGASLQARMEIVKLPLNAALRESCRQNIQSAKLIFKFLEGLVERRMSAKSLEGPIGIAKASGRAAREGAFTFIGLMAIVSLNLAIFNLLPIPILDGGVMLLLLVEMLLRRDLDLKVKEAVLKVGFVFLMMVVVFVIYNDIAKITG
jgi:regulator of sigma E protease